MKRNLKIEEQMNTNVDLLQVAKDYCEFNLDKSDSMGRLMSLLEIVLKNQRSVLADIDKMVS